MQKRSLLALARRVHGEIASIEVGGQTSKRLTSMGIVPGRMVALVDRVPKGPAIIRLHEMEIAIGRSTASCIYVKPHSRGCRCCVASRPPEREGRTRST